MVTRNFLFAKLFRHFAAIGLLVLCAMGPACNRSPEAREANYLKRGEALRDKKDFARALLEFKNAASVKPKDAEPHYQIALTYLAMGGLQNAYGEFRKATQLNPKHQAAQTKLAELLIASRNQDMVQQAANQLQEVLSTSPDNSEANDALALAEWKLGKTDEATDRLTQTLQQFPTRLQSSVSLAHMKLSQNDLAGAEQVLKDAVAAAPKSPQAELALGQLYLMAKQPGKAEPEFRKAVQLDPKNGPALLGLGAIEIAGNRMDEADKTYAQVSSLPDSQYKPLHALFLFRMHKPDAGLAELEKLYKDNSSDRNIRQRLFAAYVAMGKNDAARNLMTAVLKKNPKDTEALYGQATLALKSGDIQNAEKDINEVVKSRPDFPDAHFVKAAILRAQGMTGSEREELNEALRLKPGFLQARLTLARDYISAKEAQSALDLLNAAPPEQKGLLSLVTERNWALLALGQTKELRSVLDQVLKVKHYPDILIQDAVLRFEEKDYNGARAEAEEETRSYPEDLRGLRLIADSYVAQKQTPKAEEYLKAAAAAHPHSAPVQNLLGKWYLESRNFPAARQAFESAIAADPKFLPADFSLAQVDYAEKQLDSAHQRLVTLVTADPKNIPALLLLAGVASDMNHRDEAISRYRAVLDADSSNLVALNNLAYTLAATDPDAALTYAQKAAELAPDNANAQDTLGWIYYRKAIYQTAITYLENAVKKDPSPRHEFHLGMSYIKVGNRDLGQKTVALAVQKDPKLLETEKGW
ncbi:MAG TPA: tetratricopeptide repeat protein [Bryobacteraceae bacterium]|nr:tetratricopeptide repeat protein [Bryobacteraceae bacterium]